MKIVYDNDVERIDGFLKRLPQYKWPCLALQDIKTLRHLKRACIQRGINICAFLYKKDYMRALHRTTEEEECPICLEQYRHGELLTVTLCDHEFHSSCLQGALHSDFDQTQEMPRCPLCRTKIK